MFQAIDCLQKVNSIVTYGSYATFERVFPTCEQYGEEMSSNRILCCNRSGNIILARNTTM